MTSGCNTNPGRENCVFSGVLLGIRGSRHPIRQEHSVWYEDFFREKTVLRTARNPHTRGLPMTKVESERRLQRGAVRLARPIPEGSTRMGRRDLTKDLRLVPIIVRAFRNDEEIAFDVLVDRLGRSRRTSFYWLKRMETMGVVTSFYTPEGRGRPRLTYRINQGMSAPKLDPFSGTHPNPSSTPGLKLATARVPHIWGSGTGLSVGEAVILSFQNLRYVCRFGDGELCHLTAGALPCCNETCVLAVHGSGQE